MCKRIEHGEVYDCEHEFNCCDCGGNNCGCRGCWSCNACEECLEEAK